MVPTPHAIQNSMLNPDTENCVADQSKLGERGEMEHITTMKNFSYRLVLYLTIISVVNNNVEVNAQEQGNVTNTPTGPSSSAAANNNDTTAAPTNTNITGTTSGASGLAMLNLCLCLLPIAMFA
ncbi:unnamed protein product [Dibothriocephalus latus]|uniref:Uncharacterized protein n=1 Tax=Dibothriocephalus latus TaxID=60516 RepID=A0A3P7KUT3_DIBLA|nr:unnamed protein product [Dibothriocephalus latus]